MFDPSDSDNSSENNFALSDISYSESPLTFNMAQTPLKIELAEKCLIKFDGNRSTLREFIDNCEVALRLVNENDKRILFELIKTKITGRAKLLSQNREFDNWSALKLHLENTYSEKRSQAQWELELHSCRQGRNEPVKEYNNRIENCMVRLIDSIDTNMTQVEISACEKLIRKQTLNVYIAGLNEPLITLVKSQKPENLENAMDIALAEEKELVSRREIQKYQQVNVYNTGKKKICYNCQKPGHLAKNCYSKKDIRIKSEPIFKFEAKNKNDNKNDLLEKKGYFGKFCKYCYKHGHWITECRKKMHNENKNFSNRNYLNSKPSTSRDAVSGQNPTW